MDAIAYWLRAGCAWRLLPHDLPPWQTVYHYWRAWRIEAAGKKSPERCESANVDVKAVMSSPLLG